MDADSFWRSMIDGHEADRSPTDGAMWRGVPTDSTARILDAAIVVVRAARDLAAVVEDVLTEQRERLERTGPPARADEERREGQRIDLTY
jgi:hypothetical protein